MRKRRIFAETIEGVEALKNHREHEIALEKGSGNVFADIRLANPEKRLAKADLAIRIAAAIRGRRLTQARAARVLKIDQPKVSRLLRGQLSGFSTERLMHFLTLLGRDVEIVVRPAPRSRRQGRVRVAREL
jgi:predicted XRE-type DNA-binding protein